MLLPTCHVKSTSVRQIVICRYQILHRGWLRWQPGPCAELAQHVCSDAARPAVAGHGCPQLWRQSDCASRESGRAGLPTGALRPPAWRARGQGRPRSIHQHAVRTLLQLICIDR